MKLSRATGYALQALAYLAKTHPLAPVAVHVLLHTDGAPGTS
jgi:hypothetical protein